MIAMSPTVTLKGAVKFSMKKLLVGGDMAVSNYTGPGEILFAPATLGDISLLRLNGTDTWNVGKDAFLAATQGVTKEYKSQGFSKAMFSGEGLFVYRIGGMGILWISSFGAIIRKDVCLPQSKPRECYTNWILRSWWKANGTSSTTVTSSPGIANMSSSAWLPAA
jgi:uncharacterized protein (AIM24 family)